MTNKFSLEFYNYFMPLNLESIINYLFGLAYAKSLKEERDRKSEKREGAEKTERESDRR